MSVNNFIPTIWAARALANLHANLVYAQPGIARRDYEGEISDVGNTVKINSIGAVTISSYTKNTDHAAPEVLADSTQSLVIDQGKMFNFQIDDVDQAQTQPKLMDEGMREAGYGLAADLDTFMSGFYTSADAGNLIGSDGSPVSITTPDEAYDVLVDLGVKLDEADVPEDDRWVVVPPWFHGLLDKDIRLIASGNPSADERLKNGYTGKIARFTMLKSNRVPNTTGAKYKIQAGQGDCLQTADQIVKVRAFSPELRFADAIKGLHVYGGRCIRPKKLAVLTANRT
jgi:hypothetical protein